MTSKTKAAGRECDRRDGAGKQDWPVAGIGGARVNGYSMLPWLLLGLGALSNLLQGDTPNPWVGGLGLLTFNSLYIYVSFRSFVPATRDALSTRLALLAMAVVTCALAGLYGSSWVAFFPLLGLAAGAAMRGRHLAKVAIVLSSLGGAIAGAQSPSVGATVGYATFLSTMVTAAILSLGETVRELRATREELARNAVAEERLRFSRDLHDLLGHTLSVIVVKSEAARRIAPRDIDAALEQVTDIEAVGRQALTEIREAVSGYREGSLATELDRARSALTAAAMEPVVRQSGPPLSARTEALLGWVVREAVTNAIRHSAATTCTITIEGAIEGADDLVRLRVTDNGAGPAPGVGGTGLKGLTERLAAAGGSLEAGESPAGGFEVRAELPTTDAPLPSSGLSQDSRGVSS
ncbi:sensor histidine kinase [Streptomyces sp. NBC_00006]|uniref:sensor histidine kinase n=1 Tax=Streptomyces sp. NBC_00006 TaxID=2975619 RepID=UPI002250E40B|nr:sensor histidine kinase [Streptomyces sp. NBC_00006]MCX5533861.1 sensor histidine kinase [Streptomyces sp. NBC_00006]